MSNLLQFLWQQIVPKSERLSADMVGRWPEGYLDKLMGQKLIVASELPVKLVICDACDGDHPSKVVWLDYPDGQRAFIMCPNVGRVPVEAERLKQWEIDFDVVADLTRLACPATLTRVCVERIRRAEFTRADQDKILDALGNFAPTELSKKNKERLDKLLTQILAQLTKYQAAIIKYLWEIPVSVAWSSLPDEAFRDGADRKDKAVERALERLDNDLAALKTSIKFKLDIDRGEKRVTLVRL